MGTEIVKSITFRLPVERFVDDLVPPGSRCNVIACTLFQIRMAAEADLLSAVGDIVCSAFSLCDQVKILPDLWIVAVLFPKLPSLIVHRLPPMSC